MSLPKGYKHSEETKKKIGSALRGRIPWMKGKKHTEKSKKLISLASQRKGRHWRLSEEIKNRFSLLKKGKTLGSKNPHWKGGISPINIRLRQTHEYKLWRKSVFERDNYTCIFCGVRGNKTKLNADHIKPFADYPELRFAIDNGRTLCVECHKKTHNYSG